MQRVVDVQTMRACDAKQIASGVSGRELMLCAAKGVFQAYEWKGPVAIVCGYGNNAGDGYALALFLMEAGIACDLFLLTDRFSADGSYYYQQCLLRAIPTKRFNSQTDFSSYHEIVDCIFGTGFRGTVEGIAAEAITAINSSGKKVISVDINSGLNGDNGMAELCVVSDLTVSIGSIKQGLLLGRACDVIKKIVQVDIGIAIDESKRYLLEGGDVSSFLGTRQRDSHKGNFGYVSIMGGCNEYSGAVKLANLSCAALRSGCGVSRLILPKTLATAVAPYLLESTLFLLPDEDGHIIFDADLLNKAMERQTALAVGMGWGYSPNNAKILTHILNHYQGKLLIDADGLNTLAQLDPSVLKQASATVILTPHLKEMERISGHSLAELRENPVEIAEAYAREMGITLLLKGACTIVTDGNTTYFVNRGCVGMATAGSGDVLAGILTGMLGYSPADPLTAACGAYIAGFAGELAQQASNPFSMIASDTVAHISEAISTLL